MQGISQIPQLIRQIYEIVAELEHLSDSDRHFTPDGHLVGSIGEVLAEYHYGLKLLPASTEAHDARAADGRLVQIKATQITRIGLRNQPKHLLVLQIDKNGESKEVYNGPGELVWENAGKKQKNGQRFVSLSTLTKLMEIIPEEDRLPRVAE